MPRTYEPIASTTLGTAAQVEFTNIPGTFTDLVLIVQYGVAQANDPLTYRLNGDSAANYSNTILYGTGSATGSYRDSGITTGAAGTYYLGASTSSEHVSVIQIMSYANTNVFKTILEASGSAGKGAERGVSLYRSTSAVTSIRLGANSALSRNLVSGSVVSLYGIKAA
jgi:hypothetical protein